ncbi:MAG: class I SAM-dependent methyltransferase [Polyangiaceae bacterium]|nr:class I SAM-dependent methyltransferase [Polyangiaceae bacterium]
MSLPRLQLFEFNDLRWVGADVRDTLIESLSRGLDWGRTLTGLVGPFEEFLDAAGTRQVLDLCAGAGGPALILAKEFRRAGALPPEVRLTDLYPRRRAWERITRGEPTLVGHPEPVDATNIAAELGAGRARAIINAFHHFPPELARGILADAVRVRSPIWISEPFDRNPLLFLSFAPFGLAALLSNPVLTPERTWGKVALTWGLTPLALALSAWDGLVSTLRVYERSELEAMVAPLAADYRWRFGTYRYALGGKGYYFWGVPR